MNYTTARCRYVLVACLLYKLWWTIRWDITWWFWGNKKLTIVGRTGRMILSTEWCYVINGVYHIITMWPTLEQYAILNKVIDHIPTSCDLCGRTHVGDHMTSHGQTWIHRNSTKTQADSATQLVAHKPLRYFGLPSATSSVFPLQVSHSGKWIDGFIFHAEQLLQYNYQTSVVGLHCSHYSLK